MTKKRANGEGSICQRPDGRWMAAATINGERKYFSGKTQTDVRDKMKEAIKDAEEGVFVKDNKMTFEEWLDIWYNEYVKPNVRPTTYKDYGTWLKNHIKPGLGNIKLKELQARHIQKFYNDKLKQKTLNGRGTTISARSVRYMHVLIHEALEQAVKESRIPRNPSDATRPPKATKKEASYLTAEQINEFMLKISNNRWYTAFLTVLGTGLRLGELVALKWQNVDLEKGVIYVKESAVRVKDEGPNKRKTKIIFQAPKTQKSFRAVPIPDALIVELKKWRTRQNREKMRLQITGLYKDDGFVFTWEDGRMIEPGTLSKKFLDLVRESGYSNIHFHSLRHSYASLMLKADVHPKIVQENLGHSTISVTLDIYSHVEPEIKKAAADKINGLLEIKKPVAKEKGGWEK